MYRDVKDEGKYKGTRNQVQEWLIKQDAYTPHKPVGRKFEKNRVVGVDEQWQMDLADMQSLKNTTTVIHILLFASMCFQSAHGLSQLR